MWKDKQSSIKRQRRTSEKYLFFVAVIGGSPGILMGMYTPLYHKAAKPSFRFGIPLLLTAQIIVIFGILSSSWLYKL